MVKKAAMARTLLVSALVGTMALTGCSQNAAGIYCHDRVWKGIQ